MEVIPMIEQYPFGSTSHQSTRVIFGAAALGNMKQEKADSVLEVLIEYGVTISTLPPRMVIRNCG
jgi:hypothetical protein